MIFLIIIINFKEILRIHEKLVISIWLHSYFVWCCLCVVWNKVML